jgi:hypothetical protein
MLVWDGEGLDLENIVFAEQAVEVEGADGELGVQTGGVGRFLRSNQVQDSHRFSYEWPKRWRLDRPLMADDNDRYGGLVLLRH